MNEWLHLQIMTSKETADYSIIYELEQICANRTIGYGNKRFVHPQNVAFFSTLESAEAAIPLNIATEKKLLGDEEFRHYCLGYQICERKVYHQPGVYNDICYRWRSYSSSGELNQDFMSWRQCFWWTRSFVWTIQLLFVLDSCNGNTEFLLIAQRFHRKASFQSATPFLPHQPKSPFLDPGIFGIPNNISSALPEEHLWIFVPFRFFGHLRKQIKPYASVIPKKPSICLTIWDRALLPLQHRTSKRP